MLQQLAQALGQKTWQPWSLKKGLVWFTVVMVLSTIIVIAVASQLHFESYWMVGSVAGGVCWLAGATALILVSFGRDPMTGANLSLMGMLIRMGLPMASLVVVREKLPAFAESGFAGQLMVLFLVMLVTEVWFSLHVAAWAKQK